MHTVIMELETLSLLLIFGVFVFIFACYWFTRARHWLSVPPPHHASATQEETRRNSIEMHRVYVV